MSIENIKARLADADDVAAVLKAVGEHFASGPITLPGDAGYLARLLTDNFDIKFKEPRDV